MAVLLAAGGAYALASWSWCPRVGEVAATVVSSAVGNGPLKAGAAVVEISVPWPVDIAGYGPSRPEASSWHHPIDARAVVIESGSVRTAVVSIDALLMTSEITEAVRAQTGLADAWVIATHSHSSMGGFDHRWLAQLAGTGRFRASAQKAIVEAAVEAVKRARLAVVEVHLEVGTLDDAQLTGPRSGPSADQRVTRVRFIGERNVAQLVLIAAHPTLMPRKPGGLDPDYPGALAGEREVAGDGITLVMQTAAGNASTNQLEGETAQAFGARAAGVVSGIATAPASSSGFSLARVRFTPPAVDASRLVPKLFLNPGNNFLCGSADTSAEVSAMAIDGVVLLAVPGEPSSSVGAQLEALGGAPIRVVGLANGYLGYVETGELVDLNQGEARRQYYDRTLAERIGVAAKQAIETVRAP